MRTRHSSVDHRFCAVARYRLWAAVLSAAASLDFAQAPGFAQAPYEMERWERLNSPALNNWPQTSPSTQPGSDTVPVELLRHPLPEKARAALLRALRTGQAGDHWRAIAMMQAVLVKYPSAGVHVDSLLGVEYIRTEKFKEAAECFERAVAALPYDPTNHSNLGLSLLALGQVDRAEGELRRALQLDGNLAITRQLLDALLTAKGQLRASGNVPPGK